ncbi:hypothetical protein [Acinetobacter dispersus]|uniref:hypothetical protein n=1 Tax=Acinetobacter dispersus TaxID=70348 RepID=UPI001F4BBCB0|nr:hypothetical protein [Acinetobacter dispersus]MCH7389530.1 hypothetical protein [Acinetobacter dispersus]
MTDKAVLSGPVEIKDSSEARVAYDLMLLIANKEVGFTMAQNKDVSEEQKTRDYWLKLYSQCHRAARGLKHNQQD